MSRGVLPRIRRAGGQPSALLLFAVLLAGQAQAQPAPPAPSPLTLAGQPVSTLAAHPDLVIGFRSVVRGRLTYVARHLRAPGSGDLTTDGPYVFGWACAGGDCATDGLFLGYDTTTERFYLMLLDGGARSLTVPPRRAPWPPRLVRAVLDVKPELRRVIE